MIPYSHTQSPTEEEEEEEEAPLLIMTSQYIASVPSDGSIPSEIVEYFSKFYEISDSPANHEKYADMFTADGTIIMASNRVQGREGKVFFLSLFFLILLLLFSFFLSF